MSILGFLSMVVISFTNREGMQFSISANGNYKPLISEVPKLEVRPNYSDVLSSMGLDSADFNFKVGLKGRMRFVGLGLALMIFGIFIYFIQLLLQFVRSASEEDFFSIKNVVRIRNMGFLLIAIGIATVVQKLVVNLLLRELFISESLNLARVKISIIPNVFSNTIFIGFIVLIIAEGFSHGLKLKQEQDLTI